MPGALLKAPPIPTPGMAGGIATWLLARGQEITRPGTETGVAENLEGELGFLGMALLQPLGLNFQSASRFVR
jgi:hypothetical protein